MSLFLILAVLEVLAVVLAVGMEKFSDVTLARQDCLAKGRGRSELVLASLADCLLGSVGEMGSYSPLSSLLSCTSKQLQPMISLLQLLGNSDWSCLWESTGFLSLCWQGSVPKLIPGIASSCGTINGPNLGA